MKKINSLIILGVLSLFVSLSFFRPSSISSNNYFFLKKDDASNKKNKGKKKNNKNSKKNKKKGVKESKKTKVSNNVKINSKDSFRRKVFLFILIIVFVICVSVILYILIRAAIEKNSKTIKEQEKIKKNCEINTHEDLLLDYFANCIGGYYKYQFAKTVDEDVYFCFNFFNYDSLYDNLTNKEIMRNFLNYAFEKSFFYNGKGLKFREAIGKIKKEEIKEVTFNFSNHESTAKECYFSYEKFVSSFLKFFVVGFRIADEDTTFVDYNDNEKETIHRIVDEKIEEVIFDIIKTFFFSFRYNIKFKQNLRNNEEWKFANTKDVIFFEHKKINEIEKNFCDIEDCKKRRIIGNNYGEIFYEEIEFLRSLKELRKNKKIPFCSKFKKVLKTFSSVEKKKDDADEKKDEEEDEEHDKFIGKNPRNKKIISKFVSDFVSLTNDNRNRLEKNESEKKVKEELLKKIENRNVKKVDFAKIRRDWYRVQKPKKKYRQEQKKAEEKPKENVINNEEELEPKENSEESDHEEEEEEEINTKSIPK